VSDIVYLAWRYLLYHRFKTAILLTSITLILFVPIGLRVLVEQGSEQLTARAEATPLIIGAKGSPLELVLSSLYFGAETPEPLRHGETRRAAEGELARAIPMHVRYEARGHPIVGTSLDYFDYRGLNVASGRQMAMLGECVIGARVAESEDLGPGDSLLSTPETVFDLAGVYPLKMKVAGVLGFSDSPDDDAVFVDVKTAWMIAGLGHGHQDLSEPDAASGVLSRDGNRITANASVVEYNEITPENIGSFHFHGSIADKPITAVIVVPRDAKSSALLQGRYVGEDESVQVVVPAAVMDDLLGTVLTVQSFMVAGAVILGVATLATAILVFMLSLRLRRREISTLHKLGGSRLRVAAVMASEVVVVLLGSAMLATVLTVLTRGVGSVVIRDLVRFLMVIPIALALFVAPSPAHADALVRTQAMLASTIAEYDVQDEVMTLELEIGLGDIPAFANLMPDEIYEELGNPPTPWADRLATFFTENLAVHVDGEGPIVGRILEMKPRDRIRRDDITGEPLPAEGEPETVVFARIEFPFESRPESITLGGNVVTSAAIGFVLYHRSIAVNDFRYLSQSQTVRLDWGDPWYSSFENRGLRRTYYAPMTGFIYVEPYEVRKEIIVRPKDLQHWLDLGLEGRDTIPVDMQADLKLAVAEFLRKHHPVESDGKTVEPELAQINFLERSLRSSQVIDPPVELDVDAAILGVIFVYRTTGLPERVTMEWDLFNDKIASIPVSSVDQAGGLPSFLDPDYATLEWRNFLTNPQLPTLVTLTDPPGSVARMSAITRWPMLALSVIAVAWLVQGLLRKGRLATRVLAVAFAAFVTAGAFWLAGDARLSDERTGPVVSGLLHNIYRAFDYRDEEQIYDVLDQSVQGDLLTRIYLETRRGLVLANQGGARAKVKEIDVVDLAAKPGVAGGFIADAVWHVTGSVGHWGHIHQRRNQYRARLDVRAENGVWKLTDLEILEEARLEGTP
jgi:putative ABC transport system permease protein